MSGARLRAAIVAARAAILASSALMMLPGAWSHSVTPVEMAHLPAGLAAWDRHGLGIYRVCGPATKFLYGLPARLAGVAVEYPGSFDVDFETRREWEVGLRFQARNDTRYLAIYRATRCLAIVVTLIGGCLACEWSTRLFGARGGLLTLAAWCWMPPILGHGSLVTSDVPAAVAMLLAARAAWGFLLRPGPAPALLAGAATGLAAATKFTLLVLFPCWLVLVLGRAAQLAARGQGAAVGPRRLLELAALGLLAAVLVLDALYLFRDVGRPLSAWGSPQSSAAREVLAFARTPGLSWLARVPLPIPLELLRGLDFQVADTDRLQEAYLLGDFRRGGWWYWYPAAALFKVPVPALLLFGLALVGCARRARGDDAVPWGALCVIVPAAEAALTIMATTGTGSNSAFRYLTPSLGLLCVWAGRAAGARRLGTARLVAPALAAWLALDAATGVPDHLGWVNGIGTLCSRGRPCLLGDGLDWGQDLARLEGWVAGRADRGRTLVYAFGLGAAEPYGLAPPATLPVGTSWEDARFVAVSENILFGYGGGTTIAFEGRRPTLDAAQRARLLGLEPHARVGRTIRVYRVGGGLRARRGVNPDVAGAGQDPLL